MAERKKGSRGPYKKKQPDSTQKTLLDLFPRSQPVGTEKAKNKVIETTVDDECVVVDPSMTLSQRTDSATAGAYIDGHAVTITLVSDEESGDDVVIDLSSDAAVPSSSQPENVPSSQVSSYQGMSQDTSRPITPPLSQVSTNGGSSRHDPIVLLDASPTKPLAPTSKTVYSIFTSFKATKAETPPPVTSMQHIKGKELFDAPFPDRDSQHVRGEQKYPNDKPTALPPLLQRREKGKQHAPGDNDTSPLQHCHIEVDDHTTKTVELLQLSSYIDNIPQAHIQHHPAIQQLLDNRPDTVAPSSSPQQYWAEKWRPRCAEQVLGNEHHALYLRDWLRALALKYDAGSHPSEHLPSKKNTKAKLKADSRGVKRPRVIRQVDRKSRRKRRRIDSDDEIDSWIVDTESESEEPILPMNASEDEAEFCRRTYLRINNVTEDNGDLDDCVSSQENVSDPPSSQIVFQQLSSTILLAGPPGCGKTAAVYACADELGWEVFEVYPGIGKRGGSNLNDLIGEVGKNHLVQKARRVPKMDLKPPDALSQFLKKSSQPSMEDDATEDVLVLDLENTSLETSGIEAPRIQQSIVLLEEVDVIFKDDINFWPSIVSLIKDCKRPVVMTCNDISLVPTYDLPLQTILTFEPCPTPVAASYLQSICHAEGCSPHRDTLLGLCEAICDLHSVDLPDAPLHPLTESLPKPDLRRAIHQIQLWCANSIPPKSPLLEDIADWTTSEGVKVEGSDPKEMLRQLNMLDAHTDLVSFADSDMLRMSVDAPEALATLYTYESCVDDEVGHSILFTPYQEDHEAAKQMVFKEVAKEHALWFCNYDVMIAETAMRYSRGSLDASKKDIKAASEALGTRGLFRSRVAYQSQMVQVLDTRLIPLSGPLMPRPAVFLDYEPWIRFMVKVDDELEAKDEIEESKRTKRMTRNSQKTKYVRQIMLRDEQRNILKGTRML